MIKKLRINELKLSFGERDHPYAALHTPDGVISCMIDTGFSLGLVLPKKFSRLVQQTTSLPADLVLGNGELIVSNAYLFDLYHQQKHLGMISSFLFDQPVGLVGVEFLRLWGQKLCLDWNTQRAEFLP